MAAGTDIDGNAIHGKEAAIDWGRFAQTVTDANYTLLDTEYRYRHLDFTGTLTATRTRTLPLQSGAEFVVRNGCTGGSLLFKASTGNGVTVPAGSSCTIRCDGTNYLQVSPMYPVDGRDLATVADLNAAGGVPIVFRVDVAAGATADIDITLLQKIRVIDVHVVKRTGAGGGAGSITVKNAGNAITDAISIDIADNAIGRATSIDDANHEIASGGTLRITRTRGASSNEACTVYVTALPVA